MLNRFKPPVLWRQMLLWALLPVLILSLALAVACGDDEPTAAPTSQPAQPAVGGSDAGSEAAAEAARSAAEQAQAAAEAAQTAAEAAQAVAEGARQGEDRPTVTVIGSGSGTGSASASASGTGTGSGSVSGHGTGSGSVSGAGTGSGSVSGQGMGSGSVSGPAAVTAVTTVMVPVEGHGGTGGLLIPAGLNYETNRDLPTKSDGIFTPVSHREIYQKISSDYQEIVALTNLINIGRPLPLAEIMLLYEAGMHTRIGNSSRTLRGFARDPRRSEEFPDSAAFYESGTFLDSPISNAVRLRGEAEEYTPAQQRQAIQKSLLRIVYHWSKRYMFLGGERQSARLVDEAWAVYVGEEVNGQYPNSLAATALKREGNFGREGAIDTPLREAMAEAQQAAADMDDAAYEVAAQKVYSRFNAIFYLSTVKYMNEAYKKADAGDTYGAGTAQVEGLSFYRSIQPEVAKANATSNETIVAYFQMAPEDLTASLRDGALTALNRALSGLLLTQADLVTQFTADTGTGPSGGAAATGRFLIPAGLSYETDRDNPTKSDGIYTPVSHREIYQKISTDYQEIVALTDVVKQGRPLPEAEILLLYEAGMHTRIGTSSRTLRGFARDPRRSEEFPDSVAFYESATFLDSPVSNAIRLRGEAEEYTDAQRRQAVQKGLLRIIYHWSKRYMFLGGERQSARLVDEAWAVYVGEEVDGEYPNSLAATALKREANFGREGTIDVPLRQAMAEAQQAAADMDDAAYEVAAQKVYSRYNAIFYLGTVRYMGVAYDDVQDGKDPGTHQVEALAFYQSIQPEVAKANAASDETIIAYLEADADQITEASRDEALAALNRVASALLLTQADLVTSFE